MRQKIWFLSILLALPIVSRAAGSDTLAVVKKNSSWLTTLVGGGQMECNVNAVCPVNNEDAIGMAFNKWVMVSIKGMLPFKGGSGASLLSAVELSFLQEKQEAVTVALKFAKNGVTKPVNLSLDFEMKRVHETSKYITFCLDAVHYDARGMRNEVVKEKSFLKNSVANLTWNDVISKKKTTKFNKALVTAIQSFFGVRDFENLKQKLTNGAQYNLDNFPIPSGDPAFESSGLRVSYDAGEIAPAELGRPTAVIPYSAISSTLTPMANKLLR